MKWMLEKGYVPMMLASNVDPGIPLDFWSDAAGRARCTIDSWQPECNWGQCGMVIEKMREKGWQWQVEDLVDGVISADIKHYDGSEAFGVAGTECHARMLTAARALKVTDE